MIKMNDISAALFPLSNNHKMGSDFKAPSCNSNSKIAVELDKMSQELLN